MLAIDSNILIYYLEKDPTFFEAANLILTKAIQNGTMICVSVLIITEVLSGSEPDADLSILDHPGFLVLPITRNIASSAGLLKQSQKLSTWDALHLATAIEAGAKQLLTNDRNLLKITVPGIELVPLVKPM